MRLPIYSASLATLALLTLAGTAPAKGTATQAKSAPKASAGTAQPLTTNAGAPVAVTPAKDAAAPVAPGHFGAPISDAKPMTLASLLEEPAASNGKVVVVEGVVDEVCQNKGCWMTLKHDGQEMRVRFKDYAFFVPKDSSGKTARIEGVFEVKDVPVDEARHYLEDAGKSEEAAKITAPVKSFTFMASGVELR